MIISSGQTIEVVLAGIVATSQSPITVDYVEFSSASATPAFNAATTNSTAIVTALSAPAAGSQRKVNNLTIFNADTASILVTVQFDQSGSKYEMLKGMTVRAGDSLQYTDKNGWNVIDSTGVLQDLRVGWAQEFLTSGTWYKPNEARFVMVEVVGAGGGGGSGNNLPGASARFGGGGGGGGIRKQRLFLAADLNSDVSVTVPQGGAGGTAAVAFQGSNGTAGGVASFGSYLIGYGGGGGAGGNVSTNAGGGGGGGGGNAAGATSTSATGGTGGQSFAVSVNGIGYTDTRGGPGGTVNSTVSPGFMSYLGGGGGGALNNASGGAADTFIAGAGGNSFFSAGGGGAGGSSLSTGTVSSGGAGGGVGPFLFGPTAYTTAVNGSGPQAGFRGNYKPQNSWSVIGFCGTGGAGSSPIYDTAFIGVAGGAGGFPGGGGGGSAGEVYSSTVPGSTGGAGGNGGAGRVRVWSW